MCAGASDAAAQTWTVPVRGSWVADDDARGSGVALAGPGVGSEIVVSSREHSAVRQAAKFLAGDIGKISGYTPPIVSAPSGGRIAIHLVTLGRDSLPRLIRQGALHGRAEAYHIATDRAAVWLVGADFRGTAYAAYTLSERLGIDPLYLWTGYAPEKHSTLVLKPTDYFAGPASFKYRGLFHDDEDILPRPFEDTGYPLRIGDVPLVWYQRLFETALRLRLNMVAPYTRVHRRYEVQNLASAWGLFYTSHHYDILLSNPFGMERFGLGRARNAGATWDWFGNRAGMLNYWRGGVLENRALDALWPVGLRGAEDRAYDFPSNTSVAEQARVFRSVIDSQMSMTRTLVPADKKPVFTFTLYSEMLDKFERQTLDVPADVMLVWPDDNDGIMRGLPKQPGKWRHGVYYHLAYFGSSAKQVTHVISPYRVAGEFTRIINAGANEYVLVNVSELRDFVMETRMIADIAWDAPAALAAPDPAARFVNWWSREYFGAAAAPDAAAAYAQYYRMLDRFDQLWRGADRFQDVLRELHKRFTGEPYQPLSPDTVAMLERREREYRGAMATIEKARTHMSRAQQQFFFDNVTLGLLIDWRPTQAALALANALREPDPARAWSLSEAARIPLDALEMEILRAEWPPFEGWYRKTWIRRETRPSNVHRSYEQLRVFLSSGGTRELTEPPGAAHPDLRRFCENGNLCSGPRADIPLEPTGGYRGNFNNHDQGHADFCVRLRQPSVTLRYPDGSASGFAITEAMLVPKSGSGVWCPESGMARLDARELVHLADGRTMLFHRGGWGFVGDDPASAVHFGHVLTSNIDTVGLRYVRSDSIGPGIPRGRWMPASTRPWTGQGQQDGNGSACAAASTEPHRISVQSIPGDMNYLNSRQTGAIPYAIYGNPSADLGTPADRARGMRYSMLTWSWINTRGGGVARALMHDGAEFYRCSDVPPIKLASVSDAQLRTPTGWVSAVYGAVRARDGSWLHGWAVYEHQHGTEPVVLHMLR